MEITINNQEIVVYLFFFFISYFFTYLFLKANLFFKIIVFFMSFSVFIQLENSDSLALTVVSILGAVIAILKGSAFSFRRIAYFIEDIFHGISRFIAGCFGFLRKIIEAVLLIKSFFQQGQADSESSDDTSSREQSQNDPPPRENARTQREKQRSQQEDEERWQQKAEDLFRKTRAEQEKSEQAEEQPAQEQKKTDVRSFEEVLGVTIPYTRESVKTAYKKLCQRYHPDKIQPHMSDAYREESAEEFKRIQKAYKILLGRLG